MHFELTRLSSRGQIVIPEATRKLLGLHPGTKFALFTDGQNLLLQTLAAPDVAGFRKILAAAEKTKAKARKA
jgi:AbrB family looped-hinge helix DNA binding protein